MRESNYKVVSANKAAVSITSTLYDRRALDCSEDKPLINSLNHLTFLASSSAKVREALASDGGLERLIVILHECKSPKNVKEQCLAAWKWILAFQCLVLVGTRGTEKIRKRVVEAGIIPVIATILDNYILSTKSTWMQKINSKPQEINQSLKNPHLLSSSHVHNISRQQQTTNSNNSYNGTTTHRESQPTPSITTPTSTTPTPTPAPPSNQTIDQDIQEIFRNTRMLMQQANDTIQQTQEVIQNINNDNGNIRQTTDSNSNSNLNNIDGEAMDSSNDTPMATEVNDTEDLETIKLENNESEIPKSNNNMSANSANNTSNNTNSNNNNTKNNCKSDQKWLGDGHKLFKSVLLLHFLNKMNTTDDLTSINKELKDNYSLLMDDGPFATQLLNSPETFNILHLNLENGNTDLKDTNFFKEVITPRQIPREFSNGLLIPKEDDVIWSLQLLAFISKYTSLRNELSSTYIISGLSFRTVYHQQQQQEKERQRNQLIKNIHDQSQNHQQQQQPQRYIDPEAQRLKQLIQQLEQQENNGKQDNEIHISYDELVNLKSRLQQHQEKVRLHKLQKSSCISNQQSQSSSTATAAATATTSAVPLFAQLRNSNDDSNSVIMNSNSNPSGEVYGSNALVEAVSSSDDFYDYESDLQSDDVLSKKISNSSFKNGSESDESTNSYSTTVSSSMYSSLNINESNKYDFLFEDIREIYKCNNDDMELGDSNGDDSTNPNGNSEINENSIGMMEKFMGNTNVFNGHNFTTSKFSEKERLRRATILEKLSLKVSRNIKEERMKLRTKNRKMYFTRKSYYKNKWNYKTWRDFEINREDHQVLSVSHNNITMCPMHHKSTASYSASGNYAPSNTTTTTTNTTITSNIKQEQTIQRNQDFSLFSVDSPSMSSSFSSPSPNITASSSNGPSSNKSTLAVEKSLDTDLFPIKRLNVFPLVEKFTVKQLNPKEICYWATVIVRNSNKKDESKGGRRQCAFFGCGKWETTPRQFAKCRRCKRAKYCSKDCQSKAWTYHKYWCSAPNSASSTTSSTSTSTSNSVATVPQPVGGMAAHIGPTGIPIFSPVQPPAASITQQPNTSNIPQDNSDATNRVTNSSLLANNNTSSSSIDSNSSLERSGLEGRSDAVSSLRVSSSQPGFSYPVQQQQSSLQSQQQKQQQQQQQPQQQQQQQSQSNAQQQRTSCISALAQRFRGCQHSQRVHTSRQQRPNNQPQNNSTLSSTSSHESALTDGTSMNNNGRARNTCIPLPFISRTNHNSPNRFFGSRGGLPAVQTDNLSISSTISPSASSSSSSQILGTLRESELQLRRIPSMIEADSRPDTPTTTISSPPNFVSIVDSDSNIDDGSSTVNLTNQVPGNINDNEDESQTIHDDNAALSRSTAATFSSSQISNSQLGPLGFDGSSSISGSSSQFPSYLTPQFQMSSRSSQNPFETQSNHLIPFANTLYRQASASASASSSPSSQSTSDRTLNREKFGNMQLKRSDTIEVPNFRERINQQQLGSSSNSNSNFRLLPINSEDQSNNSRSGVILNSLLSSFNSQNNNNNNNDSAASASGNSTDDITYNNLLNSHSLNTINDNSITTLTSIPDGYHSINTVDQDDNNAQVPDTNNLYDSNISDLMDVDTNN